MPGFFSRVGTYLAGQGAKGMLSAASWSMKNPARMRSVSGALWGAQVGAAYGALSDDTSVLGGAIGGAALGAGIARYAGAGIAAAMGRGYGNASLGTRAKQFARGMTVQARRDGRGVRMAANQGYGKFRSMFR